MLSKPSLNIRIILVSVLTGLLSLLMLYSRNDAISILSGFGMIVIPSLFYQINKSKLQEY